MLASEVAELLTLNAALDRYVSTARISKEQAIAWTAVIETAAAGMTFDEARRLVVEHYASTENSLTPYALVEAWKRARRMTPAQIAADVRSAIARGIITDWPESKPLDAETAGRLAAARANETPKAIEPIESGVVLPSLEKVGRL